MVEETISLRVIQEAREEEREAMSELVRSFQPVLFYIASCHLKSDSLIKATVKTCLAKLFDLLSETEDLSSFNGKAMTMVVRACLNAALTEDRNQNFFPARGSDPKEAEAVYTAADEVPKPSEGITEREAMNVVVRMLGKLPDDQRMIFVMRYLDGMPFARISNMIHIPAEQLEKRAQLAKQALASATGRTVEEVFGIVAHAEQNKYLVIDDRKPEPAVTEAPLTAPAARKSLRPLWITAGVLFAAAAVGTGMWIFRKPEEVSALRYLTASFTGIDGLGTAEITAQESGNKRLDAIIENRSCSLRDADGNEVSDHLSNEDALTLSCTFDAQALKKAHLALTETETAVTVEGLTEPEPIDLFKSVHLEGSVNEETGEPEFTAVTDDPALSGLTYTISEESEAGVLVTAGIDEETLRSYGYVTEEYTHLFPRDEIPSSLQYAYRQKLVAEGLQNTADHFDEYGAEVANGTDPVINELAQKYIGRAGACNEIANAFIYELYGVHVKTGYSRQNTYEVSEPEAGDLVYYYDGAGNYTHVATYLGNGLVLNGNYSDGRAHITSMYESMYAQNPMVFLRVER